MPDTLPPPTAKAALHEIVEELLSDDSGIDGRRPIAPADLREVLHAIVAALPEDPVEGGAE